MLASDTADLAAALDGWEPWMTPKGPYQALQQGGMFIFDGCKLVYSYHDKVRMPWISPYMLCFAMANE